MPMKILQDKRGLQGHCLHRGQCLHGIKRVVDGSLARFRCSGVSRLPRRIDSHLKWGRRNGRRIAARPEQPIRNTPFKDCYVQVCASGAHQAYGAHLLDRLHDNDRCGGVDQDFQTIESVHHRQNARC